MSHLARLASLCRSTSSLLSHSRIPTRPAPTSVSISNFSGLHRLSHFPRSTPARFSASSPSPSPSSSSLPSAPAAAPATAAPAHEDGMSRWPGLRSARCQLRFLDWAGTLAFASSGAAAAAASGMDSLGVCIVGTVTAVGGGTIRDALILRKIPFWTEEVEYLYLSLAAAGATFWLWPRDAETGTPRDHPVLNWADAFGVGAFATIGAQNGIRAGMPGLVVVLCGVSTATFGGAVRDVTLNRPIRILHSHAELYASTAAAGASTYLLARAAGAPPWARIWAGVATSVAARYVSWTHGVRLPTWESATSSFELERKAALDSPMSSLEPGTATAAVQRATKEE